MKLGSKYDLLDTPPPPTPLHTEIETDCLKYALSTIIY